ncbi:MAG: hypothetical protein NTU49_07620 [Gammaproteobacteria bacterium]|nr:hypothetical protein [Gammaproteobacteria bacterium]
MSWSEWIGSRIVLLRFPFKKIIKRATLVDAKTPSITNLSLTKEISPKTHYMSKIPYRQIVGALLYLVSGTRPDIAALVIIKEHWNAVKHIICYLKEISSHGIILGETKLLLMIYGYVDSDHASDLDNQRSTSG